MKRNLSLLLVSLLLQGQLLPKNIIRAAYSRIRFRNPPKNLSGNNALHEQTMAGRYQYLLMEKHLHTAD